MSTVDPRSDNSTDRDFDDPPPERPLFHVDGLDNHGREFVVLLENDDRAQHAGQWMAATNTLDVEGKR